MLKHKDTGTNLEIKTAREKFSVCFILDNKGNKIKDGLNCMGEQSYKNAVVNNNNIIQA